MELDCNSCFFVEAEVVTLVPRSRPWWDLTPVLQTQEQGNRRTLEDRRRNAEFGGVFYMNPFLG